MHSSRSETKSIEVQFYSHDYSADSQFHYTKIWQVLNQVFLFSKHRLFVPRIYYILRQILNAKCAILYDGGSMITGRARANLRLEQI